MTKKKYENNFTVQNNKQFFLNEKLLKNIISHL